MKTVLTICADCERQALRSPKRAKAMAEALTCLTRLLMDRKRLKGLVIERQECLLNCPMGKICVALKRGDQEVHHHLAPGDDLMAVARKLATPDTSQGTSRRPGAAPIKPIS